MTDYIITVPEKYTHDGQDKTKYTSVGAAFENTRNDTGEVFLTLKLDFPIGAPELLAFLPKPRGDEKDIEQKRRTHWAVKRPPCPLPLIYGGGQFA